MQPQLASPLRRLLLLVSVIVAAQILPAFAEVPPDGSWEVNANLGCARKFTMNGLGAVQGVSFHDGKVYLYGDVWNAEPRVGVIREYSADYCPTNRVVWLRKDNQPLLLHPTGLTWSNRWGTFVGDTVEQKGVIYHLDWERALAEGNLNHAVLDVIDDDAAVNGSRPEFVKFQGREYIATADYGEVRPEVRLYDPQKLLHAGHSKASGVMAYHFSCGPFNQNLSWDTKQEQLTCIENVIAGRGWKLDVIDLKTALAQGAAAPAAHVRVLTFPPHDELEGFRPLAGDCGVFVTSGQKENLLIGKIKPIEKKDPKPSLTP